MKILITTDWYRPAVNGVVTSVLNLKRELERRGHEVRVLTLSMQRHTQVVGEITAIGSIGAGKIYPNARIRVALSGGCIRDLIDWQPDVVHSQCEFSTFLMARKIAKVCGCPLIHTYHTVYEDYTNYFSPSVRVGKKAAALFSEQILKRTTAVIVPTEKVKKMLRGYGVEKPIFCIPTGLDPEPFESRMTPSERNAMRRSLGIEENEHVLVYLGRLAKEKNIDELLRYFAACASKHPELRLLLVGDGPYRDALEEQVRSLGIESRVVFTGMVKPETVGQYYRLGDIFVSASQSETQGLTYIEAMASGLPLLCRKDPCLERVIEEGVTGESYETEEEFRSALCRMLSDRTALAEMGNAAEAKFRKEFSAAAFADKILFVYEAFMGRKAAVGAGSGALSRSYETEGKRRSEEEHRNGQGQELYA